MTDDEKEWRAATFKGLNSADLEVIRATLQGYCHEGLTEEDCQGAACTEQHAPPHKFHAYVCSESGVGNTRKTALLRLASKITNHLNNGWLGC